MENHLTSILVFSYESWISPHSQNEKHNIDFLCNDRPGLKEQILKPAFLKPDTITH